MFRKSCEEAHAPRCYGWTAGFVYNALGQVVPQSSNLSSNTLQYDAAGRLTRQTWADGFFATYDYFVTGEVSDICENGTCASGAFKLASFGYNNLGLRTSIASGNGTTTIYGYDPVSRLDALSHNLAGASADIARTFGRNPAGQITTRTSTNDSYAWTSPASESRSYAVNGLNQYTQAGSAAPTYDARGNLTSMGGTVWQYNSRNRLYQDNAGNSFYHGPLGQLNQADDRNFDYLGDKLVTEFSGSQIARRYVYGPGVDEPLVWYEGVGTSARRWLHADERGSIVSLSDSSGNPIAINTYDTYGVPAATNQGRFQYTGQKWIAALGMYDYKARVYAPTLGRFLQTDPIGYEDGLNLYVYVGNDPMNNTDPTGAFTCESESVCDSTEKALAEASRAVAKISDKGDRDQLTQIIGAYGKRGEDNGVVVKTGEPEALGTTATDEQGITTVTLHNSLFKADGALAGEAGIAVIVHEGSHVVDQKSGPMPSTPQQSYDTERRAYGIEGVFRRAMGMGSSAPNGPYTLYDTSWESSSDIAVRMRSGANQRAWVGSWCGRGVSCKGVKTW